MVSYRGPASISDEARSKKSSSIKSTHLHDLNKSYLLFFLFYQSFKRPFLVLLPRRSFLSKKHLKPRTKTIPKIKVLLFCEKYLFGSFFEGIMV